MTKKKIFEILLTALISAGIAFLQNLLSQHLGGQPDPNTPEVAGVIGATVYGIRNIRVC